MTAAHSRRAILGGLASLAGTAAIGAAPDTSPRPAPRGVPLPARPKISIGEKLVRDAGP